MTSPVLLHAASSGVHLASARIFIVFLWLSYLLFDRSELLEGSSIGLFHRYGVFNLVSLDIWSLLLTPGALVVFKVILIFSLLWVGLGMPCSKYVFAISLALMLVYLQIKKGFGGHWDHRELALYYVSFLMIFLPAWDRLVLFRRGNKGIFQVSYPQAMLSLSIVLLIPYSLVGIARLAMGTPAVFFGATQGWVLNRNLRPNPYGLDFGFQLQEESSRILLDFVLLGTTLIEALAVLAIFCGTFYRLGIVFLLGSMHVGIFALLNVAFPENFFLLALVVDREDLQVIGFARRPRRTNFLE